MQDRYRHSPRVKYAACLRQYLLLTKGGWPGGIRPPDIAPDAYRSIHLGLSNSPTIRAMSGVMCSIIPTRTSIGLIVGPLRVPTPR